LNLLTLAIFVSLYANGDGSKMGTLACLNSRIIKDTLNIILDSGFLTNIYFGTIKS